MPVSSRKRQEGWLSKERKGKLNSGCGRQVAVAACARQGEVGMFPGLSEEGDVLTLQAPRFLDYHLFLLIEGPSWTELA